MKYKSIKHSFLIILIATAVVSCAGNSHQLPASQYQTSNSTLNGESIDSRDDASSIDVEDVDKEEMANQECRNLVMCQISSPEQNLVKKVGDIIITNGFVETVYPVVATAIFVPLAILLAIVEGAIGAADTLGTKK